MRKPIWEQPADMRLLMAMEISGSAMGLNECSGAAHASKLQTMKLLRGLSVKGYVINQRKRWSSLRTFFGYDEFKLSEAGRQELIRLRSE